MKRAGKSFEKRFGQFQNQKKTTKKEGEVTIDKSPSQSRASNNNVGEYVEYEDVD